MPRTKGLVGSQKLDYQRLTVKRICRNLLAESNVKLKDVAAIVEKSPETLTYQFQHDLKLETVIAIIYLTNPDAETIEKMMRAR